MESFDKDLIKNKKADESGEHNSMASRRVRSVDNNDDKGKDNGSLAEDYINQHYNVNKNSLKAMEFHSADDIRQTMKVVLTGKSTQYIPAKRVNNKALRIETEPEILKGFNNSTQEVLSCTQNQTKSEIQKHVSNGRIGYEKKGSCRQNGSGKKSRGRPPKAGPSKVTKTRRITNFYIGKLSNVVPFSRQHDVSESDSDSGSSLFY